jgi:hypothetical protein
MKFKKFFKNILINLFILSAVSYGGIFFSREIKKIEDKLRGKN